VGTIRRYVVSGGRVLFGRLAAVLNWRSIITGYQRASQSEKTSSRRHSDVELTVAAPAAAAVTTTCNQVDSLEVSSNDGCDRSMRNSPSDHVAEAEAEDTMNREQKNNSAKMRTTSQLRQLVPFLCLMIPYWGIYSQMSTAFQNQACQMNLHLSFSSIFGHSEEASNDVGFSIPVAGNVMCLLQ
jgi:POT family